MPAKLFCLFLLVLTACRKQGAPTEVLMENVDTAAVLLRAGIFQNGPYGTVSGKALLYRAVDGKFSIRLDSFQTSNGPDLYVYLSEQPMPVSFIEAGKLKSTSGSQVYTFSEPANPVAFRFVSIHCKAFNHLFGYAFLN